MNNLFFNEVSFKPFVTTDVELKNIFLDLIKLFALIKEDYDFKQLVFPINIAEQKVLNNKTFMEWVNGLDHKAKSTIMSTIRKPFSHDTLDASQLSCIENFGFKNQNIESCDISCIGFAAAYMQASATLSLKTHDFWDSEEIDIFLIDPASLSEITLKVLNISNAQLINTLANKLGAIAKVDLIISDILPELKKKYIRNDHGKDILEEFSNKLLRSEYVIKVINSLPFNPKAIRFINKVEKNGNIELVLHWEDSGYGVVIKSTGRNYSETSKIAEILKEKFDR